MRREEKKERLEAQKYEKFIEFIHRPEVYEYLIRTGLFNAERYRDRNRLGGKDWGEGKIKARLKEISNCLEAPTLEGVEQSIRKDNRAASVYHRRRSQLRELPEIVERETPSV